MKEKTVFEKDLYRYIGDDCTRLGCKLRYVFGTPGVTYTYLFRKASRSRCSVTRVFWSALLHICKIVTGIQIPVGTTIGEGLRISHFGTIVVNPGAVIGRNFTIAQGALIGNAEGRHKGCPRIGDNCLALANSMIVGGIVVGDNVLVAPGAFVNFDVPDNCIVMGNPGKIIQKDESPTEKYIVYKVQ